MPTAGTFGGFSFQRTPEIQEDPHKIEEVDEEKSSSKKRSSSQDETKRGSKATLTSFENDLKS